MRETWGKKRSYEEVYSRITYKTPQTILKKKYAKITTISEQKLPA
jgi:hypothetical protein